MKLLVFLVISVFTASLSFSQDDLSKKEEKKLSKVFKFYEAKEYDKASELMGELIQNHLTNETLWKQYVELAYLDYEYFGQTTDNIFGQITITSSDKDGNEIENDSLANELLSMLTTMKPAENELFDILALGTSCIQDLERASIIVRVYGFDSKIKVGGTTSEKAYKAFQKAEKEFGKKNYHDAAMYYKEAMDADTNFYKAVLYTGDAIYAKGEPHMALKYYKKAAQLQPNLMEPKKYLTDAYIGIKDYELAQKHCIDGLLTYPDVGMFLKFEDIQYNLGKKANFHWIAKTFLPNNIDKFQEDNLEGAWKFYREAKEKVKDVTSKNGIIAPNDITNELYLEVYSWKYMLSKVNKEDYPELAFAYEMKDAGYLDCYVLFSLFNFRLNEQYQHYRLSNSKKIEEYIEKYLIEG